MARRFTLACLALAIAFSIPATPGADNTAQTLPFSQDWSNTGLISANDDWSGVPGIVGYRGDAMTGGTAVDPQTVLAEGGLVVDVNVGQSPTFATGGVAEFDGLANPVVAMQGSGTARAPHLVVHLNTTGQENITVAYLLRDVDGTADNAVQPVALQYRVGGSGNYTNVPAGFVADASTGPSLATLETPINVTLPAAVNNQALVQVRIITTDAVGADEWIGVDDISITGTPIVSQPPTGVGAANPNTVAAGAASLLTVVTTPGTNPPSTGIGVFADLTTIGGSATQLFNDNGLDGDVSAGDGTFSFSATVSLATMPGPKSLAFTVTDAQTRSSGGTIDLTVLPPPPPPGVPLPFHQDWTDISLITTDDDWSGVTGIVGYRGDDLTTATGTDPQTVLADGNLTPVDVNANQTNPDTFTTGGVAEFHLANPVVGLNGSGTADAPFLQISISSAGVANVRVSYVVRDLDGSGDNAVMPVALQYRLGNTGSFTNVPAAFVADATTGPSQNTLVTPVSVLLPANAGNQGRVDIRIITANAVGTDEWVGIDNIAIIDDDAPVPPTGVGTADPSSLSAGNDTLLTVAVTPGVNPPSTGIAVTGDTTVIGIPGSQTFNDNGTGGDLSAGDGIFSFLAEVPGSVTPGPKTVPFTVSDAQFRSSTGSISVTILPPPPPLVFIHDVQGSGSASAMDGQQVFVEGIVTARVSNGFFMQEEESDYDADGNTSEGILVFTAGAPPASAAVGNLVSVLGTVSEFIPAADPFSPPKTELTFATVTQLNTGQPLPTAITLTAADTDPNGGLDVLERFEGMRVHVALLTVVAPTGGFVNENAATGSSNGVFFGVIEGVARPFREPGIEFGDVSEPPSPPANVPRFDLNPERLRVASTAQTGALAINVAAGETVSGLTGPLDYSFFTYTILPDPGSASATNTVTFTPVAVPGAGQFTVGSANMQRLFDTDNDPDIGEPVLTATAFNNRLNKGSLFIRNVLRMPDILGVQEVENLTTLQALATRVNDDAVMAMQPNPNYVAYLEEGNDPGGIDVGFLVKASVTGVTVVQEEKDATYINPDTGLPATLHDRPPLILTGTVHGGESQSADVTVIVNHLRSLSIDNPGDANRVRTKRRAQAVALANLVQARQSAHSNVRVVVIGDFNAFQFSDGYVDSIGTIKGTPAAADTVFYPTDDLVNPDLTNLVETEDPSERYSFMFDGNAQTLDHVLVTPAAYALFEHFDHARVNADFPQVARNDVGSPIRFSDHDPVVAFFNLPPNATTTELVSSLNPSIVGQPVTFTATVTSDGGPVSGTVEFRDGAALLASLPLDAAGQADFTTSTLTVGSHAISATLVGTPALLSSSASLTQVVQPDTRPVITFFIPDHGPVGTPVLIVGERFNGVTSVQFNGTSTLFLRLTSQLILTIVPPGATSGPISITGAGGTGTSATSFTVTNPAPNILFFTPDSGRVGQLVLIVGQHFTGATSVKFGTKPAAFVVVGPNLITATVPAGAVTAPITVTTPAGSDTSSQAFKVKR